MWRKIRKPYGVFGVGKNLERQEFLLPSDSEVLKRFLGIIITAIALLASAFFIHQAFTVNAAAPTVNNISPDNGPIAGGTKITITGSGFKGEYEQVEFITFDGNSYIQTDATQLGYNLSVRVKTPTYDINRFIVGAANSAGLQIFAIERTGSNLFKFYTGSTSVTTASQQTTALTTIPTAGMIDVTFDWARQAHINGSQWPSQNGLIGGSVPNEASYYQIGGTNSYSNYFKGDFYMMKLANATTGEVVHDFVPVHKVGTPTSGSSAVYGVVDLTTGIFYGNSSNVAGALITGGPAVAGAAAPDRPLTVMIDGRACTGTEVQSDTELTCHTPSGLSLGKKDVEVTIGGQNGGSVVVGDGYEYALRLNAVLPKFGDPDETTEIEIEGGVFSTPPDSYVSASVSGIKFDGSSWIDTGFDQIGSTRFVVDFSVPAVATSATGNTGFMGARSTGSTGSFVVWQMIGSLFRSDYGAGTVATTNLSFSNATFLNQRNTMVKDDGYAKMTGTSSGSADVARQVYTQAPAKMLLGTLTTGGGYGTNGFSNYTSFGGTIWSAQICKQKSDLAPGTIYSVDTNIGAANESHSLCAGPSDSAHNAARQPRVLVRDLQASIRTSDNVCGFYDMVTGEFLTNAGYGTFSCTKDETDNILEVPVELVVTFSYVGENDVEQTGSCSNPVLLSPTKLKCTMPVSPLPNDGQGKVDLTVYANDVEATAGTADADDYYYGSPMVVETISPNRGPTAGWQTVTITGNNFHPSLNSVPTFDPETDWGGIAITIGGSPCNFELDSGDPTKLANVNHYTNTSLTCMTTSNPGGISDIEVTLDYYDEIDQEPKTTYYLYGGALDPITGAITSGYLYEGDLIAVSPNIGPTTGGTVVTITGTGFVTDPGVTTQVFFGNVAVAASNITVVSYTEIRVTTPRSAITGTVNVTVVQTGQTGYAASFTSNPEDGFEYEFVTGTGTLTPNQAYTTGGDTVLVTGIFDSQAATTVTLTSGSSGNQVITTLDPQSVNILSDTQIEIIMPAHAVGTVLVTVNQHDTDIPIANLTYVPPLTITGITPDRGPISGGTIVTITGNSFIPIGGNAMAILLSGKLDVTIGGEPCAVAMFTQYTNTSITCTTSARVDGISGLYDVVIAVDTSEATEEDPDPLPVINPNHTGSLINGYRYVLSELSLSASNVHIGDLSGSSPYGANSSSVYVQTDNPTGYTVQIRADDSNATTTNDNWMKCSANPSAQYKSISGPGVLTDETWGWNNTSLEPLVWQPINTTNSEFINSGFPSSSGGLGTDTHTVWYGAKTSATQPPCIYSAIVMFTAVANPEP